MISKLPFHDLSQVSHSQLQWIATLQEQEANFVSVLAIIFWFRLVKYLRAMSFFKKSRKILSLGKRLPLGVLMKITY